MQFLTVRCMPFCVSVPDFAASDRLCAAAAAVLARLVSGCAGRPEAADGGGRAQCLGGGLVDRLAALGLGAPCLSRQARDALPGAAQGRTRCADGARGRLGEHDAPACARRADQLGRVRFSWLVPSLIESADLTQRDRDDSPVRLVLAFEGDRKRFSPKDAMLSELAEAVSGEPMPYATLMYVWSNRLPPDAVVDNPRTTRIRKLVVESGPQRLGEWLAYERDVCADFMRAFGEAPGALVSIGVMTDTDNTRSEAQAWYGPVQHGARQALCAAALILRGPAMWHAIQRDAQGAASARALPVLAC